MTRSRRRGSGTSPAIEALTTSAGRSKRTLEFTDPSNPKQWDDTEKRQREGDPGGARPCLVFDQMGQYTATVVGQVEQSPPALHAIPAASGADQKVAEQLDGLYRNIEYQSRAVQHYMRALTSAARAGVGYLIVRPVYTDRALNYQEPRISSEGDPLKVVFDPWSVEIDGSDADRGQLLTPMSYKQFEAKYGKDAAKVSFIDPDGSTTATSRTRSTLRRNGLRRRPREHDHLRGCSRRAVLHVGGRLLEGQSGRDGPKAHGRDVQGQGHQGLVAHHVGARRARRKQGRGRQARSVPR
jgi:hypothetical protein